MVSGDADICWQGWAAMNQFAADAGVDTFKTRVPKEGSFSFCDAYALPKGADNVDSSLSWMNESLDPKVNADAAVVLVGGVTVEARGQEPAEGHRRALRRTTDLDALLERSPFYNNPPVESDEFVTFEEVQKGWQEVKAEAAELRLASDGTTAAGWSARVGGAGHRRPARLSHRPARRLRGLLVPDRVALRRRAAAHARELLGGRRLRPQPRARAQLAGGRARWRR